MACALTQGHTLDCRDSMGGLEYGLVTEFDNVSGITQAAGTVTAILKAPAKRFWKYNFTRATANWEEVYTDSVENGTSFNAQALNIMLNKMLAATSQEIKLLAQNRLIWVVKDRNGKFWLLGEEQGMQRSGGKAGSGTASGDRNGYEINFTAENRVPAPEVSSAIIAGLETPG